MLDSIFNYLWIILLLILIVVIIAKTIRIIPQSYALVNIFF